MEYFENQSRRDNIPVDLMPEEPVETLNVKLKWHLYQNSLSLSKFKLSVHIVQLMLIVGKLMAATLPLNVPHCYLSFGELKAKNPILKEASKVKPNCMFVNQDPAAQRRKEP